MFVGDPRTFALESEISCAYERLSFRALGFFLIHLGSKAYGVRAENATLLACSFDEVAKRLACRGSHGAFFSSVPVAGDIANAVRTAVFAPEKKGELFFGKSRSEFLEFLHSADLIWAPDGDEAFDDGSCVVQFDIEDRVRIVGFKSSDGYHHDPDTLMDIWLDANNFYDILDRWRVGFEAEWIAAPKVAEEKG
jgi:hypothetical protein